MNAKSLNAIIIIKINKFQNSEAFASMLFVDLHFKLIYEKSICFESLLLLLFLTYEFQFCYIQLGTPINFFLAPP